MNYRSRLVDGNGMLFRPELYAVMDQLAYQEAVEDGVSPEILRITGHPGLGRLQADIAHWAGAAEQVFGLKHNPERQLVTIVSEPASVDDGATPGSPRYRGYTEFSVIERLASALQPYRERLTLGILPHPRENKTRLKTWCGEVLRDFHHVMYEGPLGRPAVLCASGSIGMTSILLYESWLAGKPTMSMQPDLRREDLRNLSRRDGLIFVDDPGDIEAGVASFMSALDSTGPNVMHQDVLLHADAGRNLAREVVRLMGS